MIDPQQDYNLELQANSGQSRPALPHAYFLRLPFFVASVASQRHTGHTQDPPPDTPSVMYWHVYSTTLDWSGVVWQWCGVRGVRGVVASGLLGTHPCPAQRQSMAQRSLTPGACRAGTDVANVADVSCLHQKYGVLYVGMALFLLFSGCRCDDRCDANPSSSSSSSEPLLTSIT